MRAPVSVIAWVLVCLLCAATSQVYAQISSATLTQANADLQAGQADAALALLSGLPASGAGAAEAQNLLCRVRFTLQQWSQAAANCQQAVTLDEQNSDEHMWLGRVLGRQASHASFLSAYGIAKHSLSEMQTAVKLNAQNGPAMSDLGDYYAQAPGIAGGGTDKAQAIASELDKVDAARAAQLRGDIAMAQKDYTTAESEYRQAVAVAKEPADYWSNLANFYRTRQQWTNLDSAIQGCIAAAAKDKNSSFALYDGAGVLIAARRNPSLAAQMLENYLASSATTEDAPAFIAHILLSRLKQQLGDAAGAKSELAIAAQLAKEFNPAQA
jgi:tetratricopeptide (TPR) repeat protein